MDTGGNMKKATVLFISLLLTALTSISGQLIVTITSPNGGEIWETGESQDITWTTSGGVVDVKIEYSSDGGSSWNTIVASTPSTGVYPWTIPDLNSNNCLVRIVDGTFAAADISDAAFTIFSTVPTTLSPGDIAVVGYNFIDPDQFAFIVLKEDGLNQTTQIKFTDKGVYAGDGTIGTNPPAAGTFREPLAGEYDGVLTYTAPDLIPFGTVITWTAETANPNFVQTGLFSLSTIGEQIIVYQNNGANNFIFALNNEVTGPTTWQSDALLQDVTNGQYRSNIPPGLIDDVTAIGFNTEIRNRVYSTGARQTKNELLAAIVNETNWLGNNDKRFEMPPNPLPALILNTPIGGEFWEVGSSHSISWISSVNNIIIEFSANNGADWVTVAGPLPSSSGSSYSWTIPDTPTEFGKIRVSDSDDPTKFSMNTGRVTIYKTTNLLEPGDVAVVGYNFMGNEDQFAFVVLKEDGIPQNTVIKFSDRGVYAGDGSMDPPQTPGTFRETDLVLENEGVLTYTAPSDLPFGTVVTWTFGEANPGFVTTGVFALSTIGEQIIVYQIDTENHFLFALNNELVGASRWQEDLNVFVLSNGWTRTNLPPTLQDSVNAIGFSEEIINRVYVDGPRKNKAELLAAIVDENNWMGNAENIVTMPQTLRQPIFVESPNGGEVWQAGSEKEIKWFLVDQFLNVKIDLSLDNGSTWMPVVPSTDGPSRNFSFMFPDTTSDSCLVRVSDDGETTFDLSDNVFSLVLDLPVITLNTGAMVEEGGSVVIDNSKLSASDGFDEDSTLVYMLTGIPVNGVLQLDSTNLAVDNTFTQDDVNKNKLTYTHNGDESESDMFRFKVMDSQNGATEDTSFVITVTGVNDAPSISGLPENVMFGNDTNYVFGIWEFVEDVETPDSSFVYEFTVSNDSLLVEFDSKTGNVTLSVIEPFAGEADLVISVTDEGNESAVDTLLVIVEQIVSVNNLTGLLPTDYELYQNYPNPFNPSTTIRYGIPSAGKVRISIFNLLGEEVSVLIDQFQEAGYYEFVWNARNLASGMYLYRIDARSADGQNEYQSVKKLILLK